MPIARRIDDFLKDASWIRRLFEDGKKMMQDGNGPVFDFSIGNPDLEPTALFQKKLAEIASQQTPGMHKYMANTGYGETRSAVAAALNAEYGMGFTEDNIVMTVGAAGAINTALKALVDPGEEVIVVVPYFVEYRFYIDNHDAKMILAPSAEDFNLDPKAIESKITDKTRVVLINNPNNPTGVVYSQESLNTLGEILRTHSKKRDRPIFLLDDAPYRKLIYDMERCTSSFAAYENTLMATSHSKDLGIPGERIGFLAVSPRCTGWRRVIDAAAFTNRTLGYVNAPAFMQRVVAHLQSETIDIYWYKRKRDRLVSELSRMGYKVPHPNGAFYIFPEAPGGDDVAFIQELKRRRVLVVPGTGFGKSGHFRIAYCVADSVIEGALPAFEKVIQSC